MRSVRTYWLPALPHDEAERFAWKLLASEAIHDVVVGPLPLRALAGGRSWAFTQVAVPLDGLDDTELAQVADMVALATDDEAGGALRPGPEAEMGQQMGRRLVAELGIELDVEMVVLVALPGVHGSGESRHQVGRLHAAGSLQAVDGRSKWPKKPQEATFFAL